MNPLKCCLALFGILALCGTVFARPAYEGFRELEQSDGSVLRVQQAGNEKFWTISTEDGFLVAPGPGGDYYYLDENGFPSAFLAKAPAARTAAERAFLASLSRERVYESRKAQFAGKYADNELPPLTGHRTLYEYSAYGRSRVLRRPKPDSWCVGERYVPVILVSTPDVAGADSVRFYRFFNEEGFSEEGNIGSVRDYFMQSSGGLFHVHFDIFPVRLDKNLQDYVAKDSVSLGVRFQNTLREASMLIDGIEQLVVHPSFVASKYCMNKNTVDGFIFLFPGMEETALRYSSDFWAHQYSMYLNGGNNTRFPLQGYKAKDGTVFNKYLLASQLEDGSRNKYLNELGIYVHEFSHLLGLRDHYSETEGEKNMDGPTPYDIMTRGMYNMDGRVPPKYSAFERESVGWLTMTELEADDSTHTLLTIDSMQAFSITNPKNLDEYFIVEFRPATGYDMGISKAVDVGTNGVLVWYIQYDENSWRNNSPNGYDGKERVVLKDCLLGSLNGDGWRNPKSTPKTSYSPFVYADRTEAPVAGVYNFVADGVNKVCFTMNPDVEVDGCVSEESSSFSLPPSSSSTSFDVLAMRGLEASATRVNVLRKDLRVETEAQGRKFVSVLDLQGSVAYSKMFDGNDARLTVQRSGLYIVRVTAGTSVLGETLVRIP